MKKTVVFIVFLLFLILVWFSWRWYKNTVVCCDNVVEEVETPKFGPLIFECSANGKVITNELWLEKKKEIISGKEEGKKLLILAPYFDDENDSIAYERAKNVAKLFEPELTREDLVLSVRKSLNCEMSRDTLMHSTKFKWVARDGDIVEYFDHTKIFYEFGSAKEVKDESLIAYFDKLALLLKETQQSITIIGHTDSTGADDYNLELGLKRAEEFKEHLLSRGIPEDKIITESKGKSMPIATNSTVEGEQKNRRVEIRINN
ncbi:MAG: OmpA family protein [Flavobacteriaceae bacterium]|nr:OmpA family protein [Flavobacteriaceae bacterium]